jgi:hypothetical protein
VTSIVVLLAILALQGRLDRLRRYRWRDLLRLAALGVLNPFMFYVVLFTAGLGVVAMWLRGRQVAARNRHPGSGTQAKLPSQETGTS